ncbi:MAG: NDP-sugar synthase, partial [Dehalococcoidia bacterium]|nr:NDP-sugar synthase [Dehalococcoidia bacterium]
VIAGKDRRIHPSVRMSGRVIIGEGCVAEKDAKLNGPLVIGAQCRIGANAVLEDSVIWDRVTIGAHTSIRSSVIANDCIIGDKTGLTGAMLGDHIKLDAGRRLDPGARIFPEDFENGT